MATKDGEITTAAWILHHEKVISQTEFEWEWVRQREYGNEERVRNGGKANKKCDVCTMIFWIREEE